MRFVFLSPDCAVDSKEITAVLDMDRATVSLDIRQLLSAAEKEGRLINAAPKLPKSLVFTNDGRIYITPLMAQTVKKRCTDTEFRQ